jgi:hypothetical protein
MSAPFRSYREVLADCEAKAKIARLEGIFAGAMLALALAFAIAAAPRAFLTPFLAGLPF